MRCPYCFEEIKDEAIVCRYCGRDLSVLRMVGPILERLSTLENKLLEVHDVPKPVNGETRHVAKGQGAAKSNASEVVRQPLAEEPGAVDEVVIPNTSKQILLVLLISVLALGAIHITVDSMNFVMEASDAPRVSLLTQIVSVAIVLIGLALLPGILGFSIGLNLNRRSDLQCHVDRNLSTYILLALPVALSDVVWLWRMWEIEFEREVRMSMLIFVIAVFLLCVFFGYIVRRIGSAPSLSEPKPKQKWLIVFSAAAAPTLLGYTTLNLNEPPDSLLLRGLLYFVLAALLWSPIILGFYLGMAWPGRHLKRYLLMGAVIVLISVLGTTLFDYLVSYTGLSITTWEALEGEKAPVTFTYFVGVTLMFISAALFGDLRERQQTGTAFQLAGEAGLAGKIAYRFSGPGKEPSKNIRLFAQALGPSIIGLVGVLVTAVVNLKVNGLI